MIAMARKRWWWPVLLALVAVGAEPSTKQDPSNQEQLWVAPTSLRDPRLEPLRQAGLAWEVRIGPERVVVDQVCLVPDLPTFLEVIATWDRGRWFPVLFDDVESSFRFLRAFKPARIVRFPRGVAAIPDAKLWAKASEAVGASWRSDEPSAAKSPRQSGDAVPEGIGPTPPGVVVTSPDAPMFAGAVALAAGRFQPLARLNTSRRFAEVLTPEQARTFCQMVEAAAGGKVLEYRRLGDACDFLTLAGDWPYRYREEGGDIDAVDDLVGRSSVTKERWAFAGRLLGDARQSVYQAMCALFLQPDSALMFNGYDESSAPWSDYSTRLAATRFSAVVPTTQVSGSTRATIHGWHEAFGDTNPHGLVWANSHGSPTVFNVQGGPGCAADVPRGVPTAVAMIHSFSAADPTDPDTIAGRWLANGAFIYYGSVYEPFLQSFRSPLLIGDLLGEKLPMAAAVRQTMVEPFGKPWHLIYLGDPLYRVRVQAGAEPRSRTWGSTAAWPRYAEADLPTGGPDASLLAWSLQTALARLQVGNPDSSKPSTDLADVLAGLHRDRLAARDRPVYDALLAEILLATGRRGVLLDHLARIPDAERTANLRRLRETCLDNDLDRAIASRDFAASRAIWAAVIDSDATRDFKDQATTRVGQLATNPGQYQVWIEALREALRTHPGPFLTDLLAAEIKRIEAAVAVDGDRR